MDWYWIALVVLILGIGILLWFFRKSLKKDEKGYDHKFPGDFDDVQSKTAEDVPAEPMDIVPPPPDLNAKHFNDAYLLHIEYERFKRKYLVE
jgi:hypothetical protein